jgi:hypothetical protein
MRNPKASAASALLFALLAAIVLPLLYLKTYPGSVHSIGWDSYGYMWQSRAVGLTPLADIGTRLGVPMIGSMFEHVVGVRFDVEPVVVGLSMMVGLALCTAAILRVAFDLPGWSVALMSLFIGWWGGTSRLAAGYQANVLSLLLFTTAAAVFLRSKGRTSLIVCGFFLMFACGITHPGFMPVYVAIAIGWAALSFRQLRRDKKEGRSLLRTEPVAAAVASIAASLIVAFITFVVLHHTLRDVADFSVISGLFGIRLTKLPGQVGAVSAVPLACVGIFAAWRMRRGREDLMLSTLGVTWLAACLGGLFLGLVISVFPAHRAVLFATPVAAAMALGVVYCARYLAGLGVRGGARRVVGVAGAVVVVIAAGFVVAAAGRKTYADLVATPRAYVDDAAQRTAGYLEAAQIDRPVIIVTNRTGLIGILVAKLHYNASRAFAPTDRITNVYIYLGNPSNALLGEPTYFENPTDWQVYFNKASKLAWPAIEPIFKQNPVILFNQVQVTGDTWGRAVTQDPSKVVAPGLFVAKGPLVSPIVSVLSPISPSRVGIQVLICVLLLAGLGGGYAWAAIVVGGGRSVDVAALAPGFGAGVAVLAGIFVASLGVVPGSAVGFGAMVLLGAAGYVLAFAARRRVDRTPADTGQGEPEVLAPATSAASPGVA